MILLLLIVMLWKLCLSRMNILLNMNQIFLRDADMSQLQRMVQHDSFFLFIGPRKLDDLRIFCFLMGWVIKFRNSPSLREIVGEL